PEELRRAAAIIARAVRAVAVGEGPIAIPEPEGEPGIHRLHGDGGPAPAPGDVPLADRRVA
ncbi:MAG: hypothetical protein JJE23_08110, partial [Thermoleophilia bacterium]|nr:hypothetical protein [Thermoleophilia bacterium]